MKRLIIGQIENDFNPKSDIPIGPWCFWGREKYYPEWEKLEFEETFNSNEEFCKCAEEIYMHIEQIVPFLSQKLNRSNQLSKSNYFWKVLLYNTLLSIVSPFVEARYRVRLFAEKYKNENIVLKLIDANKVNVKFKKSSDILYGNRSILQYIYSTLFHLEKLPKRWKVLEDSYKPFTNIDSFDDNYEKICDPREKIGLLPKLGRKFKRVLSKMLVNVFRNNELISVNRCHSVFGFSDFQSAFFFNVFRVNSVKDIQS